MHARGRYCCSQTTHSWLLIMRKISKVNVVKVAEEWKISFKQHLFPIKDEEQMLCYSLEFSEHENTALCMCQRNSQGNALHLEATVQVENV